MVKEGSQGLEPAINAIPKGRGKGISKQAEANKIANWIRHR
jgi:hypothetical protein